MRYALLLTARFVLGSCFSKLIARDFTELRIGTDNGYVLLNDKNAKR